MSKPNTSLASLTPSRIAPRIPVSEPETVPMRKSQPGRAKTVMIAGHFDPDVSFAVHELCGKLTRQNGKRVTVQQALAEALGDWFTKHGAPAPDALAEQATWVAK
jgi:hypothetical protein